MGECHNSAPAAPGCIYRSHQVKLHPMTALHPVISLHCTLPSNLLENTITKILTPRDRPRSSSGTELSSAAGGGGALATTTAPAQSQQHTSHIRCNVPPAGSYDGASATTHLSSPTRCTVHNTWCLFQIFSSIPYNTLLTLQ